MKERRIKRVVRIHNRNTIREAGVIYLPKYLIDSEVEVVYYVDNDFKLIKNWH